MRLRLPALLMSMGIVATATALAPACDRANPLYRAGGAAGDMGVAGDQGAAGDVAAAGQGGATGPAGTTGGATPDGGAGTRADASPPCLEGTTRVCYEGAPATINIGPCRGGTQTCANGVWSACSGQVLPAAAEACNGVDDDCNSMVDDGLGMISCGLGDCAASVAACTNGTLGVCAPAAPTAAVDDCDLKDNDCDGAIDEDCATVCLRVAPNGDDTAATGAALRPFRSIQAAINYAAAGPARPKVLCVAGGNDCTSTATYQASDAGTFTMSNGVSVYGNYESRTWTRCAFGATGLPTLTVTLQPRTVKGVTFPATVTMPTILDGVRVVHFTNGNATTTSAVTVEGAKQVVISNVVIADAQDIATSYGVNLTGGAEALITRSVITGGLATSETIGVRSVQSKPTIRDNCADIDPATGRCIAACGATSLGIHGRFAQAGMGGGNAMAVDLIDSPGAIVERNALCGTTGSQGFGIHVAGQAQGIVVRGNTIVAAGGGARSHGIWMDGCGDDAPWIVGNELIQADGAGAATRLAAVGATGGCHPVIDSNVKITGGGEGVQTTSVGVFCGAAAGVASRCAIVGNALIQGSPSNHPATSIAVSCDAGGCVRVSGNKLNGQNGGTVIGLSLTGSGPLVERNEISGGCGTKLSTALLAEDAWSRIENNVVRGSTCAINVASPDVNGVHVHVAASGNEIDVHSNTIETGGVGLCKASAAGIGLGAAAGPKSARGIFRNNILRAVGCTGAHADFLEDTAGVSPRVFENNDLDPTGLGTTLYLNNANMSLNALPAVNALPGASGNISVDPMFLTVTNPELSATSACVGAGTPTGAPKTNFDGKPRTAPPNIGAF